MRKLRFLKDYCSLLCKWVTFTAAFKGSINPNVSSHDPRLIYNPRILYICVFLQNISGNPRGPHSTLGWEPHTKAEKHLLSCEGAAAEQLPLSDIQLSHMTLLSPLSPDYHKTMPTSGDRQWHAKNCHKSQIAKGIKRLGLEPVNCFFICSRLFCFVVFSSPMHRFQGTRDINWFSRLI